MEPLIQQVLDKYPSEAKLVIKHFPLRSHRFARQAAAAALAANEQGKFWEFHEELLKNYRAINEDKIQEIAKELKLELQKFNEDRNSPVINELINRDLRDGRRLRIRGIPTVLINGKILMKHSRRDLEEAIAAALSKTK
ncbi:MAG: DsbA family protein [Desulfobacteraceae bacterium]